MATRYSDETVLVPRTRHRELFCTRYPDYLDWVDGNVWELDIETDIHDDVNRFRSALHYQCQEMGLKLATKTVTNTSQRRVLLVQAYSPQDQP